MPCWRTASSHGRRPSPDVRAQLTSAISGHRTCVIVFIWHIPVITSTFPLRHSAGPEALVQGMEFFWGIDASVRLSVPKDQPVAEPVPLPMQAHKRAAAWSDWNPGWRHPEVGPASGSVVGHPMPRSRQLRDRKVDAGAHTWGAFKARKGQRSDPASMRAAGFALDSYLEVLRSDGHAGPRAVLGARRHDLYRVSRPRFGESRHSLETLNHMESTIPLVGDELMAHPGLCRGDRTTKMPVRYVEGKRVSFFDTTPALSSAKYGPCPRCRSIARHNVPGPGSPAVHWIIATTNGGPGYGKRFSGTFRSIPTRRPTADT